MADARPLSLLIVIGAYHPIVGGGERHAQLLAETLAADGHRVRVLTRRTRKELAARETLNGVEIERVGPSGFPRLGKYLLVPAAMARVWQLRKDFDVCLVCAFRVLGWVGAWARRVSGKPVVLRAEACGEWSGAFASHRPGLWLRAYLALRNRALLRCDRFLAISGVIRDEYLAGGIPPHKILSITNGIDFRPFHPAAPAEKAALRRALGWAETAPHWASTGKLIRGKGMDLLIRALARLRPDFPELRLVLIGGGGGQFLDVESELRRLAASLGVADRVIFTGYSDRVPELLRACDGFVFASEAESLGLAAVEALATGLPALVSDVGGLREVLPDDVPAGRRLPVGDLDAWTRAWAELLREPPEDLARRGLAGRESVLARYDIRVIARQTVDALRAL